MNELVERARTLNWLTRVGSSTRDTEVLFRPNLEEWQDFVRGCSEFVSNGAVTSLFEDFEWLAADGPNPNKELARVLDSSEMPLELRDKRRSLTKEVLRGLREIKPSPWLVVGAIDLREAVRQSAAHAFRLAAAEAYLCSPGFWERRRRNL